MPKRLLDKHFRINLSIFKYARKICLKFNNKMIKKFTKKDTLLIQALTQIY